MRRRIIGSRRLPPLPAARPRRRSRRSLGTGGGKGTRSWPPTTRTPPPWGSRRPPGAAERPGASPSTPLVLHRRRRPTSTRPTPPPSTPRCGWTATSLAADAGGAVRSARRGAACRRSTARSRALVVAADMRTGLAGQRRRGGRRRRRRRARSWATTTTGPVLAEYLGGRPAPPRSSSTAGARPGEHRSKRLGGALRRGPLRRRSAQSAWDGRAEGAPASSPTRSTTSIVAGTARPGRARRWPSAWPGPRPPSSTTWPATVGNTGAAHPSLLSPRALETAAARPGDRPVSLADGADVLLFRRHRRLADAPRPARPVAAQVGRRRRRPYGKYLAWRGLLDVEPPRRPEPARVVGRRPAARRGLEVRLRRHRGPPRPARSTCRPRSRARTPATTGRPAPMADVRGHRRHLHGRPARLLAEPAGRLRRRRLRRRRPAPVELTDVDPDEVAIGNRVEMTFRGCTTADGIHNYFWKARPVLAAGRARTRVGSHGIKDRVAIVGMGCTPLRRALGQGRSTSCSSTPPNEAFTLGRRRPRTTSTPTGSAPPSPA